MGCIFKCGGTLHSRVTIGAVLLAAGSGSRMGHRPKSLLELGGVPLIRQQLIALSGAGVDEVVVVLGHYADQIEETIKEFPVKLVRNPDPDAGQVSSLRLGLQSLSIKLDAVLIALADQPLINSQDIKDLIGAYKKRPQNTHVVQPSMVCRAIRLCSAMKFESRFCWGIPIWVAVSGNLLTPVKCTLGLAPTVTIAPM